MGVHYGPQYIRTSIKQNPTALLATADTVEDLLKSVPSEQRKALLVDVSTTERGIWATTRGNKGSVEHGRAFVKRVAAKYHRQAQAHGGNTHVFAIVDNELWRPELKRQTVNRRKEKAVDSGMNVRVRLDSFTTEPKFISTASLKIQCDTFPDPTSSTVDLKKADGIIFWSLTPRVTFVMAKSEADTLAFLVCRQGFLLHVPLDPSSTLLYSKDSDWILNLPPEFCHRRIFVDMSIPDSTQDPANKLNIAPRRGSARPQCSSLCLIDTMVLGWDGEKLIIAGILAGGDYFPGGLPSVAFKKAFNTYKECLSRKFWEGQELGVVLGRFRAIKKVEKLSDTFVKAIEELRNNMPAIFALLEKDEGERFNKFDCAGDQASPSDHSVPIKFPPKSRRFTRGKSPGEQIFPKGTQVAPAPRSQPLFEVPPDAWAPPSEWFFGNSVYQPARAQNAKTPARQFLCQPRESIASLKSTKDAMVGPGKRPYEKRFNRLVKLRRKESRRVARAPASVQSAVLGFPLWESFDWNKPPERGHPLQKKPGPEPTRAAAPPVEPTHTATSTQAKPAQAKKSSTSKSTLAGKEYSGRTRRCEFTKSLREQLPPSPDGKRKHRSAEFFSDLMRVQVVIGSIEAKVYQPCVRNYVTLFTDNDWKIMAASKFGNELRKRVTGVFSGLHLDPDYSTKAKRKDQGSFTTNTPIDPVNISPDTHRAYAAGYAKAANPQGGPRFAGATGALMTAVDKTRAAGLTLGAHPQFGVHYEGVVSSIVRAILGWKDKLPYVLAEYGKHLLKPLLKEQGLLSGFHSDDVLLTEKGQQVLLDIVVSALRDTPHPVAEHQAEFQKTLERVDALIGENPDGPHAAFRTVFVKQVYTGCGVRDIYIPWALPTGQQGTLRDLVGVKLTDFSAKHKTRGGGGSGEDDDDDDEDNDDDEDEEEEEGKSEEGGGSRVQFPAAALLPLMHHLLIRSGHTNGIVPTIDSNFIQCTPGYLATILSNPVRVVRDQAKWLYSIVPALVTDHGAPEDRSARYVKIVRLLLGATGDKIFDFDQADPRVKQEWSDDALESVRAIRENCFGSHVAKLEHGPDATFFRADDFRAFGFRLADVLFKVESILSFHEIPAGSWQTDGVHVHLRVMDIRRASEDSRAAGPPNSGASNSIRDSLIRAMRKAKRWHRLGKPPAKRGVLYRSAQTPCQHYVDGVKETFLLSCVEGLSKPRVEGKPRDRMDALEDRLREEATQAGRNADDAVHVKFVPWRELQDVRIVDGEIYVPSLRNDGAFCELLETLQGFSNKKFHTNHSFKRDDLITEFNKRESFWRDMNHALSQCILVASDLGHERPNTIVARVFDRNDVPVLQTVILCKQAPNSILRRGAQLSAELREARANHVKTTLDKNKFEWSPLALARGFPEGRTTASMKLRSTTREARMTVFEQHAEHVLHVTGIENMRESSSIGGDSIDRRLVQEKQVTIELAALPELAKPCHLFSSELRPIIYVAGDSSSSGPNPRGVYFGPAAYNSMHRAFKGLKKSGLEVHLFTVDEFRTSSHCWHLDCRDDQERRNWVKTGTSAEGWAIHRVLLGQGTCTHMPSDRDILGARNCAHVFEHFFAHGLHPFRPEKGEGYRGAGTRRRGGGGSGGSGGGEGGGDDEEHWDHEGKGRESGGSGECEEHWDRKGKGREIAPDVQDEVEDTGDEQEEQQAEYHTFEDEEELEYLDYE
ncbi:BZ3500_MvSof-1268-A1-R1_Chr8-1g10022 [Microbotryum saponariae]|uniref:BZ3500_MvSof-1268-A1-R1_Chr8-1g10022 protein n=1 Tax=Microbotryum saponariae TaxID=289078 RepID=A0A2X0KWA9_9BASI|nr:BZ3500_MvSof-1268-A1-R1_Chr8-1g10022 [Microbotryum saponariae]SDA08308.1 BZ3501_MvSof-1269-A2-R1_Chr8-1g09745 [Microbotryum saponariae]